MSVATLLNAASANTTGPVLGLGTAVPYGNLTATVTTTGTVSALSVQVQGSNDGVTWANIGSAITSPTAGTSIGTGILFQYFQATLSGYSGTGTVTCLLAYSLATATGGGGPPTGAAGGVLTGTYPNPGISTLNQNTSGTAANLSGTPALPNGTTATTQTTGDSTTKLATTAFVQGALPGAASTSAAGIVELDGTATDIAAAGTQSFGSGSLAAISTHVHPENTGWTASDQGFKAWNYDPVATTNVTFTSAPAAGTIYLARINIRAPVTIAGSIVIWWQAPASGSPANSYLGLYTSGGAQVGSATSDFTATGSGVISKSIGGSQSLSTGYYYVAFVIGTQGTTKGGAVSTNVNNITGGSQVGSSQLTNAGYRWATNGTGASALPTGSSAFTMSSNAASPYTFWCALL